MKIYATMMIYNELPFLDYVFEVLQGFCDHIVLMDNGSVDGSREWVAQPRDRVTAILGSQEDPPHYSNLCNKMLKVVPDGAWVLRWDPDELPSIGFENGVRAFLEADQGRHVGWKVPIYHLVKDRFSCLEVEYGHPLLILFLKTSNIQYHGRIHEQVTLDGPMGIIGTDSDMAFIHLSHLAEKRFRRKAEYYSRVDGGRFPTPECLTSRLTRSTLPLPDHIQFEASDEWLESIKRAK